MEPQPMLIIIRHSICTCFLVEYQQYFDRFSRDGLLDKQGFRSVLQCLEIDPPQCVVDEMFAEHDKDGRFCRWLIDWLFMYCFTPRLWLLVWFFSSRSRIFRSYENVIINRWRVAKFRSARRFGLWTRWGGVPTAMRQGFGFCGLVKRTPYFSRILRLASGTEHLLHVGYIGFSNLIPNFPKVFRFPSISFKNYAMSLHG